MESWTAKLLAVFCLFAVVIIFGLLPAKFLRLADRSTPERSAEEGVKGGLVDWLSCFAGGVFLATTMVHLLPDVRLDYEAVEGEAGLPVPELLVCIGFFVVLLFEHGVMELRAFCGNKGTDRKKQEEEEEGRRFVLTADSSGPSGYGTVSESGLEDAPASGEDPMKSSRSHSSSTGSHVTDAAAVAADDASLRRRHDNDSVPGLHRDVHVLRSLVFLVALSTHTVFEGLALGLQSHADHVLTLLGAVLIHKAIVSFTVGVRFVESYRSFRLAAISLVVLAAMAPIGVVVGIAVSEFRWSTSTGGSGTDLVRVGMQGVAAGTFLYVTFFEVLPEQLKDRWSLAKSLTVVLGFSAIVLLEFYVAMKHQLHH